MTQLANVLSDVLGRPVIDKTGFTGTFDVKLDFTPEGTTFGGGRIWPSAGRPATRPTRMPPTFHLHRPAGATGTQTGIAKRPGRGPRHRPRRESLRELRTACDHRPLTITLLFVSALTAAEHKGKVQFGGLPVPRRHGHRDAGRSHSRCHHRRRRATTRSPISRTESGTSRSRCSASPPSNRR